MVEDILELHAKVENHLGMEAYKIKEFEMLPRADDCCPKHNAPSF